ncbi:MAG: flagellar hook-associated protein FlgK [Anaerolinea sp.]|nr:flagellar hook-associated protein FlgK [Anaerolinea sp.]
MALAIGLDTAVKALRAQQLAVDVASHNIANAQTPGFSRQRVLLRPVGITGADRSSYDSLLGRAGMGVDASDVRRMRDLFLDFQTRQTLGSKGQYSAYSQPLSSAQVVFNDPTDDGLSGLLGKFWASWQDVVNDPESSAARITLVHSTSTLAARIQRAHADLTQQRLDLNTRVISIADQVNAASEGIATLNFQIKQVELNGEEANDLRDRRDLLLDQLSSLGQITYNEQADKTVTVYLGDHELVTSNLSRDVAAVADTANPGMTKLVFAIDGNDVTGNTGELRGVLDARDVALPGVIAKLNTLATGLIGSINTVHQSGFGLDGSTGNAFLTGTGAANIALNAAISGNPAKIAAAANPASPGDGSQALAIANLQLAPSMIAGTSVANLAVGDTLSAGNTAYGITIASLQAGSYYFTANGADLDLRYGSPTGPVVGTATLAAIAPGAGTITFVNGAATVATIQVNNANLLPYSAASQQADLLAAGNNTIQIEASPDAFYANMVSVLGADVNGAEGLADSSGLLNRHLEGLRQSTSGVNLDEEISNLNAAQKAYESAARVITTIDEMLDTLINMVGR